MQITKFYATPKACQHMEDKHRVAWDEMRDVMAQGLQPRRLAKIAGERRYWVTGYTEGRRLLKIIFAAEGPGTARVITAFEVRR